MKKTVTIIAAAFALGVSGAMAGNADSLAACEAFAENNEVSPEPCTCIADAVSSDEALKAEQLSLETMEDYENASDALRSAIEACVA